MHYSMKRALVFLLLLLPIFVFAQSSSGSGNVKIVIQPVFDSELLILETGKYVDAHGDSLYIDEFRFYISGLKFIAGNMQWAEKESYHLIDAGDKTSQVIYIKDIPAATYEGLSLVVGVDSVANTSGANGGDLDPVKGMYWAWNTGYIMAKLQGRSSICKTLHHAFEFHIGGYLPPFNAARNVHLQLPKFKVEAGKESVIYLNADAAEWLKNPETIDLSKINEVNMPGKDAMRVADNYMDMLSVRSLPASPKER